MANIRKRKEKRKVSFSNLEHQNIKQQKKKNNEKQGKSAKGQQKCRNKTQICIPFHTDKLMIISLPAPETKVETSIEMKQMKLMDK